MEEVEMMHRGKYISVQDSVPSSTLFFFCCIRNKFVGDYQSMALLNDFFT